jgi:hypothetical protein
MPDLTNDLLPRLQAHRLPGLDLGDDFIYPHYPSGSIMNIPSSLCQLFEMPGLGAEPLFPEILSQLGDDVRRVVFILMDALSLGHFREWLAEGVTPVWNHLLEDGFLAPLTSVTPSTTTSAITSIWSGVSPSAHGILGYELWLKEYGVVANMIAHTPITFKRSSGSLENAGFIPERFLQVPMLGPHLRMNGVTPYSFSHFSISNSGLSRMYLPEVERRPFSTVADLWVSVRELLENRPQERQLSWIYWGKVDGLSHIYGPETERPKAEFEMFSKAFERYFINRLSPEARKGTLLILTADHGQITTPKKPRYELREHPELTRRLHIQPTGENRLMFLFVRPGHKKAVRAYIEQTWPDQFTVMDSLLALKSGLFGPEPPLKQTIERMGDLVVLARGNAYLWWAATENPLIGRHGGLTPKEMLVPFLAVRLG